MYWAFQNDMLELVSKDSQFAEALAKFNNAYVRSMDDYEDLPIDERPTEDDIASMNKACFNSSQQEWHERAEKVRNGVLLSGPEAWVIPSEDQISEFETKHGTGGKDLRSERVEWRFSAAAAAIHFLENLSLDTLLGIGRIVLHEDRPSLALPESHAQGLIPFCQQNPNIRVERRINMWRILVQNSGGTGFSFGVSCKNLRS